MTSRPYVLLSCAVSVDGCLDAPGPDRLILSGAEDLDRVDGERAGCDAIMVGAGTIRRDDPRLLIRSPARRAARAARGLPEHPAGVTLTASGDLDPGASFFAAARPSADGGPGGGSGGPGGGSGGPGGGSGGTAGARPADGSPADGSPADGSPADGSPAGRSPADRNGGPAGEGSPGTHGAVRGSGAARLVYCASPAVRALRDRLAGLAEVIDAGPSPQLPAVLADLAGRGVQRLMVEGGSRLGGQFLAADLVDELHVVVAPFFVGDPAAPRFAPPGRYPHGPARPMTLAGVRQLGQVVLLRYLLAAPGQPAPLAGQRGTGDG